MTKFMEYIQHIKQIQNTTHEYPAAQHLVEPILLESKKRLAQEPGIQHRARQPAPGPAAGTGPGSRHQAWQPALGLEASTAPALL